MLLKKFLWANSRNAEIDQMLLAGREFVYSVINDNICKLALYYLMSNF